MDANLKKAWVEALRSGEYKQGNGQLLDRQGRYCCLGVLAKVAGWKIGADGISIYGEGSHDDGYNVFYRTVGGPYVSTLWWWNDSGTKSFKEIADYIEENIHADT